MPKSNQPFNPFYVLLVFVGIAFVLTVFAYSLMLFPATSSRVMAASADQREHPLWQFLDRHGIGLIQGEVAFVAILTCAAIGTDRFWLRRSSRRPSTTDATSNRTDS